EPSGDQLGPDNVPPSGTRTVTSPPPRTRRSVRPRYPPVVASPLVLGLTLLPASLRCGAATSAIDGTPLRSSSTNQSRLGESDIGGAGSASRIAASAGAGSR